VDNEDKITLRFIKSQQVFGGIYLFEKIEVDSRGFLLLMTSDMTLHLLKIEAQDRTLGANRGGDLIVTS